MGGCSQARSGHGGETIKNIYFIEYLRRKGYAVCIFDTVKMKRNPTLLLLLLFEIALGRRDWVISAATHTSFRLLKWMEKIGFRQRQILYFVIGGTIGERLQNGQIKKATLSKVTRIYVETSQLEKNLKDHEISNVSRIPNFKPVRLNMVEHQRSNAIVKLIYVSRVIESKGIFVLLDVIIKLKEKMTIQLDVYGPVGKEESKRFKQIIDDVKGIHYKGFLDFYGDPLAYQKLSVYDAMVLPTSHYGEGFPGVFIDCFMAGIPIITTNWNSNADIIQDGYNGFLIPDSRPETLYDKLESILKTPGQLAQLRMNCLASATQYDIDVVLNPIFDK